MDEAKAHDSRELKAALYRELQRIAAAQVAQERAEHTLSRTALVHEAWLRLADYEAARVLDEPAFLRLASRVMRHVLIDHARARKADKRGGGQAMSSLDQTTAIYAGHCLAELVPAASPTELAEAAEQELDFIRLDTALERLAERSPRQAEVVELKFFGGLSIEAIAATLQTSTATVKRDWTVARLFLLRELQAQPPAS